MVSIDEMRSRDIAYSYEEGYTTCSKCGKSYQKTELVEYDTWNLGNYGCTMNNCPTIHKGWKDDGCPHCNGEGIKINESKPIIKDDGKPAGNRSYPKDFDIDAFMMMEEIDAMDVFTVSDNTGSIVGEFYIDKFNKLRRNSGSNTGISTSIMWNLLLGRYSVIKERQIQIMKAEDNGMIKYAIVKLKNNRSYTFMHYAELKLKQGDTVVCDTAQGLEVGIVSDVDAASIPKSDVTKFIIQRVDISAFNEMKSRFVRIKGIQDKMEERRKNIEQMAIYKMMAEQDPEMARLYQQMEIELNGQPTDSQEEA